MSDITFNKQNGSYQVLFSAMNNPCELIFDSQDGPLVKQLTQQIAHMTWVLEAKYSRFKPASLCSQINLSQGLPITIDEQTYELLCFAEQCYQLSDGLFDITSGILSQAWDFSSDTLPAQQSIDDLLRHVGWHKVQFDRRSITLPQGMAIDFGGIVKEYAVDKAVELLRQSAPALAVLVNFGGDLAATSSKQSKMPWTVGIDNEQTQVLQLHHGALATSGDTQRFILANGIRYGHILNAKTGWPAIKGPSTVTVAAPNCLMAGMLATMAMLWGEDAEPFLQAQGIEHWCSWQ